MQVFGQVFRAGMQVPGQVFRVGMQVFGQVFRVGMPQGSFRQLHGVLKESITPSLCLLLQ